MDDRDLPNPFEWLEFLFQGQPSPQTALQQHTPQTAARVQETFQYCCSPLQPACSPPVEEGLLDLASLPFFTLVGPAHNASAEGGPQIAHNEIPEDVDTTAFYQPASWAGGSVSVTRSDSSDLTGLEAIPPPIEVLPQPPSPIYEQNLLPVSTVPESLTVSSPRAWARRLLRVVRVAQYPALPVKASPMWIVLYVDEDCPIEDFRLLLSSQAAGFQPLALKPDLEHSWRCSGTYKGRPVEQIKLFFMCPNDTYKSAIFEARLTNTKAGVDLLLGGLRIISTSSERKKLYQRVKEAFPNHLHQRLVDKFMREGKRHYKNGKGRYQPTRQEPQIRIDELKGAVKLPNRL